MKRSGRQEGVEAFLVATVLEKKPAAIPPFEAIKAEVIEGAKTGKIDGLRKEKAKERAFTDAQDLFNQRADSTSLDALLEKYKAPEGLAADRLSVQESNLFSLSPISDYIAGIGNSAETMFAAFQMTVNDIDGPFKGSNAVYIIQLVERQEPDVETFQTDPAEKAKHQQILIQAKKRQALSNWLAARKEASELWIHPDFR